MLSYHPLWKYLESRGIGVLDFCHDAVISPKTLEQLNGNESVELSVIECICGFLDCEIDDVVKIDN